VGYETGLIVVGLAIAAGILTRLAPGLATLYLGTLIAGVGIALGNVLVPALVKRDFPDRVGVMTGAYTMALSLSAAVAAGLTVPIEDAIGHGWRPALAVWALPALVAGAVWLPLRRHGRAAAAPPTAETMNHHAARLWRSSLAWQVTFFFGLQSLSFYSLLSWLPALLHAHGLSKGTAGAYLSAFAVIGAASCLAAPTLGVRLPDQRALVAATIVSVAAGLTGLLVSPGSGAIVWTLLLGIGQGSSVALAFLFFALRSPDDAGAAQLSSMAQSVGYMLAATGPIVIGALHQATDGWTAPLIFLLAVQLPEVVAGIAAGRSRLA
jgi:CP family cyanate transporter-like MFS transporter